MKKILKVIPLVCLALSLQNCEEELIVYGEDSFVQLESSAAASVTENSGAQVAVTAILGSPQATDITVNFDVTGDASRFTLTPGPSVTIPAGQTSGTLTFEAVDDDDINGDVDITIALSSTSGLPIGIGGEGVNSVSKTITIVDDNVPCNDYTISITADRWGSEVIWDIVDSSGAVVVSGGPYSDLGAGESTTDQVAVALPDGCYTFRQFDWYGDTWGAGSATAICGALVNVDVDADLTGIPGLDINTVPVNPAYGTRFRASGSDSGAYVNHAEATDFCVNQ